MFSILYRFLSFDIKIFDVAYIIFDVAYMYVIMVINMLVSVLSMYMYSVLFCLSVGIYIN